MENENNKIKLSQYIQACVDLKEDPADAVKESKINNFLDIYNSLCYHVRERG